MYGKRQMCPHFQIGDKADPSNYRPISQTCVLCKVIEHIVASSLSKHFTELNILYELSTYSEKGDPVRRNLSC